MKNISWLDKFAQEQMSKTTNKSTKVVGMQKTASAKKIKKVASADKANVIIMAKDRLPGAKDGNTVKYRGAKWKVIQASYKDAAGDGVVLKRISPMQKTAAIDEKPINSPQQYGRQDPGNVYDYNVRETSEIPDFQAAAAETEQAIARDNSYDRTTPAGRYTNPSSVQAAVAPEAFDGVEIEEVDVTEVDNTDVVDPDVTEDTPVDEMPVNEVTEDDFADVDADLDDEISTDEVADETAEEVTDETAEEVVEETETVEDDFADIDVDLDDEVEETEEVKEEKTTEAKSKSKKRTQVAKKQNVFQRNPILSRIVGKR